MKVLYLCFLIFLFSGCKLESDGVKNYPLLSLFDADESMDGKNVLVTGYFGYWEGDVEVLYATFMDYKSGDGLYKSHLILDSDNFDGKSIEGKICTFKARVWYRHPAPTLDNATLQKCHSE